MTSRERFFNTLNKKDADRVPVMPFIGNWGAKLAGYKLGEYHTNGKNMADAHYRAWLKHGLDEVNPQSDNYYIAQGLGVKVRISEDATPIVTDVPVKSFSDIDKLKVPNPYTDGRMPVYLEAISLLNEKVGKDVIIRAPGTGPFSMAGHLMGVANFIETLAEAEMEEDEETQEMIMRLMDICTDSLIAFATACVKCGATMIQNGDSLSSINMTSPTIYRKYAFPYQVKFTTAMKELQKEYEFATLLHVCGNNNLVAREMMSTGHDCIEVDQACNLTEYKKISTETGTLMLGNLSPSGPLMSGSPEDVYKTSMESLEIAAKDGFFVLGSGCEVAISTPVENVRAMISAAEDFAKNNKR